MDATRWDPSDFESTLTRHLDAIAGRDFTAFAETVAPDEVVLISATGELTTSAEHLLALHKEWFASPAWSLETDVLHTRQGGDLGTAVIALHYREGTTEVPSLLSLVFQRRDGRWLMVQDQNTPVKGAQTTG